MSNLIHPVTKQPCAFVAARDGFVCLRCDYVSPQVRWFTLAQIEAANPVHTCALPIPLRFDVLPEMVGTFNHAIGVTLVYPQPPDGAYVIQPAPVVVRKPVISLWSEGLRVA